MLRFRSEIHGAPEDVEDTAVHVGAHCVAEFGVEGFGVAASEVRHILNSQQAEIPCNRRSDSGDALDRPGGLPYYLSDHTASSFPPGSVK